MNRLEQLRDDWTRLGAQDPLWAVYVAPGTRGGRWDVEEFFALGRREVDGAFAELPRLGLNPGRALALDFGCGAIEDDSYGGHWHYTRYYVAVP